MNIPLGVYRFKDPNGTITVKGKRVASCSFRHIIKLKKQKKQFLKDRFPNLFYRESNPGPPTPTPTVLTVRPPRITYVRVWYTQVIIINLFGAYDELHAKRMNGQTKARRIMIVDAAQVMIWNHISIVLSIVRQGARRRDSPCKSQWSKQENGEQG